jgi:hypothetical protein
MTNEVRDEFTHTVKRTIALRVNYRCSNPICGANTSGPQLDPVKSLSVGVAAHITAAAPGGPRYNSNLSEEQRKSSENGIWLCQNCAKLVDNDPLRFAEDLLRHWKQAAEQCALQQIGRRSPFDKADAPELEIVVGVAGRTPVATSVEWYKGNLLDHLLTLVPADIEISGRARLLASGQGALGQPYAIVGLASNHDWNWTIILFTAGEFGWDLVARTNLESQKGHVPEVLYIPGTPGALAVTHVHGWGTGVFRRSTSWYRIARGAPVPLLSYPYSFYVAGWAMPFDRELTSKLLTVPQALTEGATLDLQFDVTYSMGCEVPGNNDSSPLFSITEKLSLEWSEPANVFVPRTAMDDFARIEEIWSEGTEAFIKHNSGRLQELARSGTEQQQRFIKEHLS